MILVTGATGSNGTEIVKLLAARGIPVRAMVRNPERAKEITLPGVEIVAGDFDRPETLDAALTGVERAFLLTPSSERAEAQQRSFVEAAKRVGTAHLVKLSQFAANPDSPVRFLRYHAAIEAAIQEAGITYTFLRPNLFMQGLLNFQSTIATQNAFYAAAGDALVSMIDVRDIAAVAMAALTEEGHEGKIYELTGPRALTHAEAADELSAVLGRRISFVDIPPEEMREAVLNVGFPVYQADGLLEDYAHYRRGEAATVSTAVQDVTGKPPRDFTEFARDFSPAFAAQSS